MKYPYDPKRAIALMDEMGLKPDARGIRQRVNIIALPYGEVWTRQAELVKQQFGKVGIEVTIETTDAAGFLQRNSNWDFELCFNFLSQFMDPAMGVARTYISSNIRKGVISTNVEGYSNPEVDDLFARAAVSPSEREAQKLYSQVAAHHQRRGAGALSDRTAISHLRQQAFRNVIIDAHRRTGDFDQAYQDADRRAASASCCGAWARPSP